jgi:hypothetical protein
MDFKPSIVFIGALMVGDFNEILKTSALILNLGYLGYQFYIFHKKNNNEKNK